MCHDNAHIWWMPKCIFIVPVNYYHMTRSCVCWRMFDGLLHKELSTCEIILLSHSNTRITLLWLKSRKLNFLASSKPLCEDRVLLLQLRQLCVIVDTCYWQRLFFEIAARIPFAWSLIWRAETFVYNWRNYFTITDLYSKSFTSVAISLFEARFFYHLKFIVWSKLSAR